MNATWRLLSSEYPTAVALFDAYSEFFLSRTKGRKKLKARKRQTAKGVEKAKEKAKPAAWIKFL